MADTTVEHLHVELVAADRTVWSGEAAMIIRSEEHTSELQSH